MNRRRWGTVAAVFLGVSSAGVLAQDVGRPSYEGRLLRRHEEQTRRALADELRFERARRRARLRYDREEMYERMGRSPLRPYTRVWPFGFERD